MIVKNKVGDAQYSMEYIIIVISWRKESVRMYAHLLPVLPVPVSSSLYSLLTTLQDFTEMI